MVIEIEREPDLTGRTLEDFVANMVKLYIPIEVQAPEL